MKYLLSAAILGFFCWAISEMLEIIQAGYSPSVYYLTAGYHFFAGAGVWGLYLKQTPDKNQFNLVSASITSLGYFSLTLFPIKVMQSGLTIAEFTEGNPVYKLVGLLWFAGMILFCISIIQSGFFPKWTGMAMIVGTLIFTTTPLFDWPVLWVNISNLFFAAIVIYISILGLNNTPHNRKKTVFEE